MSRRLHRLLDDPPDDTIRMGELLASLGVLAAALWGAGLLMDAVGWR